MKQATVDATVVTEKTEKKALPSGIEEIKFDNRQVTREELAEVRQKAKAKARNTVVMKGNRFVLNEDDVKQQIPRLKTRNTQLFEEGC